MIFPCLEAFLMYFSINLLLQGFLHYFLLYSYVYVLWGEYATNRLGF